MIKDKIQAKIKEALVKKNISNLPSIAVENPAHPSFGDYSSSIALQLSKSLKRSPMEIAQEIVDAIDKNDLIEKIELAKPGFINMWISPKALLEELNRIAQEKSTYGEKQEKRLKILLEYGQPNTHKLPHIGHLFSYVYGESLARILEHQGNTIFRANYQGDVGLHVAKCLYKVKEHAKEIKDLKNLTDKVRFLQKCYQEGSAAYVENEKAKNEINALNKEIFEMDSSIIDLWKETRGWSVEYYKNFETLLGIHYDRWYFETETGPIGKKLVEEHIGDVFEKSAGAVVFKGEKYGLHTRVFINKLGLPTYEAKDVGLYQLKKTEFPFDLSIVAIANEQSEYQKVVMKASELVFPELAGKLSHIAFGMINLTTGKMSSRTGHIINAIELVDATKEKIKGVFSIEDENIVNSIALSAVKYSFLHSDPFHNMSFDLEKSISKEGDSGPYLLYTYVRCQSVLQKETQTDARIAMIDMVKLSEEEQLLLRQLHRLPEVTQKAAQYYSPHLVATYLFELAKLFNLFYQKNPILKAEGDLRTFRLLLTQATAQVIQNGLYLLGINTVEKM